MRRWSPSVIRGGAQVAERPLLPGPQAGGHLVEMSGSAGASCHLVIGVGLNLAMPSREGRRSIRPGPSCATSSPSWWIATSWPPACCCTCSRPCRPSNRRGWRVSSRAGTGRSLRRPAGEAADGRAGDPAGLPGDRRTRAPASGDGKRAQVLSGRDLPAAGTEPIRS